MKMKGGNIDVEYRKVIDEQNLAEMNLLNAKALLETNIIQILEVCLLLSILIYEFFIRDWSRLIFKD
jgi:hypothetical protein